MNAVAKSCGTCNKHAYGPSRKTRWELGMYASIEFTQAVFRYVHTASALNSTPRPIITKKL